MRGRRPRLATSGRLSRGAQVGSASERWLRCAAVGYASKPRADLHPLPTVASSGPTSVHYSPLFAFPDALPRLEELERPEGSFGVDQQRHNVRQHLTCCSCSDTPECPLTTNLNRPRSSGLAARARMRTYRMSSGSRLSHGVRDRAMSKACSVTLSPGCPPPARPGLPAIVRSTRDRSRKERQAGTPGT